MVSHDTSYWGVAMDSDTLKFYSDRAIFYSMQTSDIDMKHLYSLVQQYVPEGSSILDFGCGSGRDVFGLGKLGYDTTGFDISKSMCSFAGAYSDRPVFTGSLSQFKPKSFDCVYSVGTLHHMDKTDRVKELRRIKKILKSTGKLIISNRVSHQKFRDTYGRYYAEYGLTTALHDLDVAGYRVLKYFTTTVPGVLPNLKPRTFLTIVAEKEPMYGSELFSKKWLYFVATAIIFYAAWCQWVG